MICEFILYNSFTNTLFQDVLITNSYKIDVVSMWLNLGFLLPFITSKVASITRSIIKTELKKKQDGKICRI